jgi:hypothetical protein
MSFGQSIFVGLEREERMVLREHCEAARNAAQFLPNTFRPDRDASAAYAPIVLGIILGMSFGFLAEYEIVIRRP